MAPRSEHAVVVVFSTQARSNDERTILVEAGGATPMRWFLEQASQGYSGYGDPPRKRRKVEHEDGHRHRHVTKSSMEATKEIPLFRVMIDLVFPDSLNSEPPSAKAVVEDVEFEEASRTVVAPYGIESDDVGTKLRLSLPYGKGPVLILECDAMPKDILDLMRLLFAVPFKLNAAASENGSKSCPASIISCTLCRSVGQRYNVVRLQASLGWRTGVSAFLYGAPIGATRIYPDYEFLLHAYQDHVRESFDQSQVWTPQDFYESVHVPSKDIVTEALYENVLDSALFPFQKRAIAWMLNREGVKSPNYGDSASRQITDQNSGLYRAVADVDGRECYVNHLQGIISRTRPTDGAAQLRGGILAEEMGLGKTVELMALVMLHKRPDTTHGETLDQHTGRLITTSGATLIITPPSILQQWQSELTRHAPSLRVYHYQGIQTGHKKGPSEKAIIKELATNHDVVLATYSTLTREVHFAEEPPDRAMRHARQYERKRSPLIQIEWWRICLDEAQMIESGVTAAARVACRLPRVNSWAVSGTPLRKDVQDLQGLLIFLRYHPFSDDTKIWVHLIRNHKHLFRFIFEKITLRHTKALILDELHLPPQKRVVVTVPFSVIEQQNYSTLFQEMCNEVGVDSSGTPREENWDPENTVTLEKMRSWLVRLRQTCLHPQVGGKNRRALGRKNRPLRTVGEVLEVMIEQNETNLRLEERALINASLIRAHILGNNGEDERRSEKALNIYKDLMGTSETLVKDARKQLAVAVATATEQGEPTVETEDEDSSSDSTPILGRLRNNLRTELQLHHACTFFAATAYFQIKTNHALTLEGSERYKEMEIIETALYDSAKAIRKEILQDTSRRAENYMQTIKELYEQGTITKMPKIKDFKSWGGIESRRIVEKADELFDVIREQAQVVKEWRAKMADFLLKPLVDEESEGIETTGDEYEDSTKQQDELYVYFDAFKAVHADLNTFVTGENALLADYEVEMAVKNAKRHFDPRVAEDQKTPVHAPELALKLYAVRNRFRVRKDQVGSIRGLIQEARALEGSLQLYEGSSRAAEHHMVKDHLAALNLVYSEYHKALAGLDEEMKLFRTTQNQRLEFYRQLQELSDTVAPYKEEHDKELDQKAVEIAAQKEGKAKVSVAQLKTKGRFLLHLRDEAGGQAGPKICIICTTSFEQGVLTVCGHQFCKDCIPLWFTQSRSCPTCKQRLTKNDVHDITFKPQVLHAHEEVQSGELSPAKNLISPSSSSQTSLYTDVDAKVMNEIKSIDLPSSYGTKIDTLAKHLHWIREHDPGAKSIVFSQFREFLDVLGGAFKEFKIGYARLGRAGAAEKFRTDPSLDCLLLDAKTDSSGLTLVNATHVFLCEPLLQTAVELQAIARVHRIGQSRPTTVWMYLLADSVEGAIYDLSVTRRLAHVRARMRRSAKRGGSEKSGASTPAPGPLGENALDAANSEELQAAPLTKLLVAGKSGGEIVGKDDLWQCLFGKAQRAATSDGAGREVGRHLRAEAAAERRREGGAD